MSEITPSDPQALKARIRALEQRLADARARLPQHSISVALFREIDELELELVRLRALDDNTDAESRS